MKITPLKDVKPFKTEWQLHVKVLLTWKQCTSKSGKTFSSKKKKKEEKHWISSKPMRM